GIIYLSDQTHHSVEKGLKIIGFTSRQFRFIETDDLFQIKSDVKESEGDKWLSAPEEEWVPYFKELGIKLELERIKEDLNTFG
ncbi:hypothetical protein PT043_08960, partial [Erysipelothrix rhusiopathiae]|nr:hypothetical protein [Erysipelothrix rhusiopathiae]